MRVENKREEREGRGWGSIRGRVEEERIKRKGEVMKTGAVEIESLLIFRTISPVFAYSLMVAFFCNSTVSVSIRFRNAQMVFFTE